jgi:hypothetical protein
MAYSTRVDVCVSANYSDVMSIKSKETVELRLGESNDLVLVYYRDLVWFSKYKFYVVRGCGQSKYVIANVKEKNRTIQLHQLILPAPKGLEVDHINRNGLDNRRSNLRIVTHQQNQNNQPKRAYASSKYFGVSICRERNSWQAGCNFNGKRKNLGQFKTEIEAAVAYNNFLIMNGLQNHKRMNDV